MQITDKVLIDLLFYTTQNKYIQVDMQITDGSFLIYFFTQPK